MLRLVPIYGINSDLNLKLAMQWVCELIRLKQTRQIVYAMEFRCTLAKRVRQNQSHLSIWIEITVIAIAIAMTTHKKRRRRRVHTTDERCNSEKIGPPQQQHQHQNNVNREQVTIITEWMLTPHGTRKIFAESSMSIHVLYVRKRIVGVFILLSLMLLLLLSSVSIPVDACNFILIVVGGWNAALRHPETKQKQSRHADSLCHSPPSNFSLGYNPCMCVCVCVWVC